MYVLPDLNSNICSHIKVDEGAAIQWIFSTIAITTRDNFVTKFCLPSVTTLTLILSLNTAVR